MRRAMRPGQIAGERAVELKRLQRAISEVRAAVAAPGLGATALVGNSVHDTGIREGHRRLNVTKGVA